MEQTYTDNLDRSPRAPKEYRVNGEVVECRFAKGHETCVECRGRWFKSLYSIQTFNKLLERKIMVPRGG